VGRAYTQESLITAPLPDQELLDRIDKYCRDDVRDRVLTQEILLYLGLLVRARPELFRALLTIRVSHLIGLLTGELSRSLSVPVEEAYEGLLQTPPSDVQSRLLAVMTRYSEIETLPQDLERLHARGATGDLAWSEDLGLSSLIDPPEGWRAWRQFSGVIDRRPTDFYTKTWHAFKHVPAIVVGDKLERRNRVESGVVLSDMTPGEKSFALLLEHLLNKIPSPEYRQLNVEALSVIASFFGQNADLEITDAVYLDSVIGHAVKHLYLKRHPELALDYDAHKGQAWSEFYNSSPAETTRALAAALRFLLTGAGSTRRPPEMSRTG
jgi:phosphorylase kinase alpha/beta subunit